MILGRSLRRTLCAVLTTATMLSLPVHECCLARRARGIVGLSAADATPPTPAVKPEASARVAGGCCGCKKKNSADEADSKSRPDAVFVADSIAVAASCDAGTTGCGRDGCCESVRPAHHRIKSNTSNVSDPGALMCVAQAAPALIESATYLSAPASAEPVGPPLSPLLLSSILRN
jgi:hypothetical protein